MQKKFFKELNVSWQPAVCQLQAKIPGASDGTHRFLYFFFISLLFLHFFFNSTIPRDFLSLASTPSTTTPLKSTTVT